MDVADLPSVPDWLPDPPQERGGSRRCTRPRPRRSRPASRGDRTSSRASQPRRQEDAHRATGHAIRHRWGASDEAPGSSERERSDTRAAGGPGEGTSGEAADDERAAGGTALYIVPLVARSRARRKPSSRNSSSTASISGSRPATTSPRAGGSPARTSSSRPARRWTPWSATTRRGWRICPASSPTRSTSSTTANADPRWKSPRETPPDQPRHAVRRAVGHHRQRRRTRQSGSTPTSWIRTGAPSNSRRASTTARRSTWRTAARANSRCGATRSPPPPSSATRSRTRGRRSCSSTPAGTRRRQPADWPTPSSRTSPARNARKFQGVASEIRDVSDTETSDDLADAVAGGAAFHHAGLTPDHRELVEDAFRDRLLKVVSATPTLAAGSTPRVAASSSATGAATTAPPAACSHSPSSRSTR